jgi:hypothetical protein
MGILEDVALEPQRWTGVPAVSELPSSESTAWLRIRGSSPYESISAVIVQAQYDAIEGAGLLAIIGPWCCGSPYRKALASGE